MKKRILSLLLVVVLFLGIVPLGSIPVNAATPYQTNKADVPIWTSASSKSTKAYTIGQSGTVISVVGSTTNSSGNLWYKLSNGYWVFSGNVTKHSHKYTGGICTSSGCGYEWPYSVSSKSGTFVVTNSGGAKLWSRPYSNKSTNVALLGYGTAMTINGSTKNQEGNTWYRRTDGYWVFSGNVTERFTVSYHANGGSGAPSSQTVLSGNYLTLSSTKPSRAGYVFRGWSTSSSASSASYSSGGSYRFTSGATLYAVWQKCSHSYKGGICSTCGTEYSLSISSFNGTYVVTKSDGAKVWSRPYSSNSTNVRRAAYGSVLTVTHQTTNQEKHVWYRLSDGYWVYSDNVTRRHTVSYNANGGKNAPSSQTVLDGNKLTITSKKPTRAGYIFQGWGMTATTTSVSYKPSSAYSFTGNRTLYAVWKKCSHNYKGGICSTCGTEYSLSISSHSGTYVVTSDSGAKIWSRPYSNNSTHVRTASKNTVLAITHQVKNQEGNTWYKLSDGYWVYSGNVTRRYTVSYNANGGKNAPSAQTVLNGKKLTLSSKKPTRVGYTFKGWATSSGSSSVSYKPSSSHSFSSNKTLYAVWAKCSHTYKGGICSKCNYEYPLTLTKHAATYVVTKSDGAKIWPRPYSTGNHARRDAYRTVLKTTHKVTNQEGNTWYKLSDGKWVYAGNVTRRFAITYNANGGSGAPSAQTVLEGSSLTITTKKPTRTGYLFQGWGASASANKITYQAGKTYSLTSSKTVYAVWSKCSTHSYNTLGYCTKCKLERPYTVKKYSTAKLFQANTTVTTHARPFSGVTPASLTLVKGDRVYAKAFATVGNATWYQLSNGNWALGSKLTAVSTDGAKQVTTVKAIYQPTGEALLYLTANVGKVQKSGLIPGLMKSVTRTKGGTITTCTAMVPQGITFAGDYLMISAYCKCGNGHHSVIYVLDDATRTYKTTIILDDYCHVGGLAKQGDYVWVCDSGGNKDQKSHLRSYSYAAIKQAVDNNMPHRVLKAKSVEKVATTPSYLCSANGYLYVGTHYENAKEDKDGNDKTATAVIHYYSVSGDQLNHKGSFSIKGITQLQGIAIRGNAMVVTSSLGRLDINNSKLYVFKSSSGFKTNGAVYSKPSKTFRFANMAEGCYIGPNYTYVICESGAKEYRSTPLTRPLDKYVGFSNKTLGIS